MIMPARTGKKMLLGEKGFLLRKSKRYMDKYFLSLVMTFFLLPCSSDTLEIQINNISKGGILHLAVYDSKEVFESDRGDQPGPQPGIVAGIVKEVSTGVFTEIIDVPSGIYAIGLYIDANKNKKLDTNFLGIPKEQFGFSNDARGTLGPPDFESASFELIKYKKMTINL